MAPIPKSVGPHLAENLAAADITLSERAVARIDAIDRTDRVYDPDWAPWR